MFVRTRALLADTQPPADTDILDMTIGEPRLAPPDWLTDELVRASENWQAYPKPHADAQFLDDIETYFAARLPSVSGKFPLAEHLVPVPGTREPLHHLGLCVKSVKTDALAFVSNPYYHAWRTGAMASDATIIYLNAFDETGFLPDLKALSPAELDRAQIMYLCSPSNPQGALASADYIAYALECARRHNFLLVMDECYLDIWRNNRPVSALEVACDMAGMGQAGRHDDPFSHLVVLNSLSKRSSAAGLRVGFLCGDRQVIAAYKKLIANGGALIPTPLLHAGGALYRDEIHNQNIRAHYDSSFDILASQHQISIPDGGFFLWLKTAEAFGGDDRAYCQALYGQQGIRTIPGSLMAADTDEGNPGAGYVRLAIVHDHDMIRALSDRLGQVQAPSE